MNNEEKILAMLTQIQQEQAELKADVSCLKEDMKAVKVSQMNVELVQFPRISAALDGVVGAIEKDKEQDGRILALENKVDRHDVEITYLKAK